ncbi:MAG: DUF3240 family protein [Leptothrix ochracea]|uniref:DUF3240 family protein n=1 Tax=Leptothrix ochracea TaxID=735331 RepID=UPI0034E24422
MSATATSVCLNLVLPLAMQDAVVDWLLGHPALQVEFSQHVVSARGPWVRLAPGEEEVQGSAARVQIQLIVERTLAQSITDEMERLFRGADGGYWLTPVERMGAFRVEGQQV